MKMVARICQWCHEPFETRLAEIKRGNGKFCNLSCSAHHRNSLRPIGFSPGRLCARARKAWLAIYGSLPTCEICGAPADIHHIDGDRSNNAKENMQPLCRSHHISLENRLGNCGKGTWYRGDEKVFDAARP